MVKKTPHIFGDFDYKSVYFFVVENLKILVFTSILLFFRWIFLFITLLNRNDLSFE